MKALGCHNEVRLKLLRQLSLTIPRARNASHVHEHPKRLWGQCIYHIGAVLEIGVQER